VWTVGRKEQHIPDWNGKEFEEDVPYRLTSKP